MERLLSSGLLVAVVAVTIQTAIHLVNAAFIDSTDLDANVEGNPFTWASTAAMLAGAYASALRALLLRQRRRAFVALAALLSLLSLDEMAVIHERIARRAVEVVGLPAAWDSVLWPALYAPLLGGVFAVLFVVARAAPARAGRYILFGLGLLAAAVVAEVASAPVSTSTNWAHTVEGAFEEGAELGGWIAIATALTVITLTDLHRAVPPRGL